MPKGPEVTAPMKKSETASDVTNIFGIVRNRRFSNMTKRVKKFPTNISNERNPRETDSRMTCSLLLDLSSFNMSASCFSVGSIFCSFNQIDSLQSTCREKNICKQSKRWKCKHEFMHGISFTFNYCLRLFFLFFKIAIVAGLQP